MKISDYKSIQGVDKPTKRKSLDIDLHISLKSDFNESTKISFYRDLALSISAGADLASAIGYLKEGNNSRRDRIIGEMYEGLLIGKSFAESLKSTNQFSDFEIVSIDIGEESGSLVKVLETLAESKERAQDLKRQLISISSYPLLLLFMTAGILVFMLYFVVPTFEDLYSRFDSELPALTQWVLYLSSLVNLYSIGAFLVIVTGLSCLAYARKDGIVVRKMISKLISVTPVVNTLYQESILAQYFGYFSMMLKAGLPINSALEYLSSLTYSYPLREHSSSFRKDIEAGNQLHISMEKSDYFNSQTISLIRIGEDSNSLDKVFDNISIQYRKKSAFSLKTFGSVVEPVMIVFIAGIVAVILLAMYLPIFNFSSAI